MAYKRRLGSKTPRKMYRRRKTYRKRKVVKPKYYTTTVKFHGGIVTITPSTYFHDVCDQSISDIDFNELTAFQQLYDEYRIIYVQYKLEAYNHSYENANYSPTIFYSVLDKTDVSLLGTVDQALDYTNCLTHRVDKTKRYIFVRGFKPYLPQYVNTTSNVITKVSKPFPWLELSSNMAAPPVYNNLDAPAIGIKIISESIASGQPDQKFIVTYKFTVQFRNRN